MNPRYLAYCRAHEKTPEEMHAHDAQAWPGGSACGFILWMSAQLQAFEKESPRSFWPGHVLVDQAGLDRFLGCTS